MKKKTHFSNPTKDEETHELVIDTSETFDDSLVKSELIDDEPTVKRIKFDQIWKYVLLRKKTAEKHKAER